MSAMIVIGALLLDQLLGEAKRYHPLVGFGNAASWLERRVNTTPTKRHSILLGLFCLISLTLPTALIILLIQSILGDLGWVVSLIALYWAIGLKSLQQHTKPIQTALSDGDLEQARHCLSRIVSRDTESLDQQQITTATVETTLENGCDAIFGALFWFMLFGAPMVVFYRLSNTLDAMWGYRTQRYEYFGKPAAKLDDLLNYLPARLTALSYAICGYFNSAINSWMNDAKQLESPNAGLVMTAGAGSLNLRLGGPTCYQGSLKEKAYFGGTELAQMADLDRANKLVIKTTLLWCACIIGISICVYLRTGSLL